MATLVLQAAGQAVGGLLGPVGAIFGKAAGTIAGGLIDSALFGGGGRDREIGRLDDLSVQTSSDGNPIPRVYGRMRLAGTVIWATRLEEDVTETSGGKGGPTIREYSYYANFAVGICEGPVSRIARVWADGKPLDLAGVNCRVYFGDEAQAPDPLIEAKEGTAPAYRGLAYVVFERLPIGDYGNRLPQLTFEVVRAVDRLEPMVRAVTVIPGASEFGYHTSHVKRITGPGETATENRHLGLGASDFETSIDELQALCPNLEQVALVVAWFGDDLRAGACRIEPAVELAERETLGASWGVAGLDRSSAKVVSQDDGRPSYGGTPADASVVAAIKSLKARGLKVTFYPFLLMDVPPGNGKPDPYGGAEQPAHPWRGRITVDPAPGEPGSPDGTAEAATQLAAFVGTAAPGHYAVGDGTVSYSGPAEWTLRRMTLHYAALAAAAGGVDAFLIASELRGLTTVRGEANAFPFVDALVSLATDAKVLAGAGTKVSYAADWSEFFGHQPADGSGDVFFHLDPLWASPEIAFVGIDVYWPLADWRDGDHLDAAIADSTYAPDYLAGNVAGGEGFDWYYPSAADRIAQNRAPITDGAYGKDWVFRYKDLAGWWSNAHFDRIGGVEEATPTAWVPEMKPFWLTEIGCPAVDRGANQPNVFHDPKSSESFFPYFSGGGRDDAIQRRYLEAIIGHFDPAHAADPDATNPVSSVYGGRMVEAGGTHLWTWDARPWPAFPFRLDVWADGANWDRGHWLTGRLGGVTLRGLVAALFADYGLPPPAIEGLDQAVDGFIASRPASLRELIAPLAEAFVFAGCDTGTGIRFLDRNRRSQLTLVRDDLAEEGADTPLITRVRQEEHALPVEQRLAYLDSGRDFTAATARARRLVGDGRGADTDVVPVAMADGVAARVAEVRLGDRWAARNEVKLGLPPSRLALETGDVVDVVLDETTGSFFVEEVEDAGRRSIAARSLDRSVFSAGAIMTTGTGGSGLPAYGPPLVHFMDLPILDEEVPAHQPWIATHARPWPGTLGVWKSVSGGSYDLVATIDKPALMGVVTVPPAIGPTSRWDETGAMTVRFYRGTLTSHDELDVLAGKNALAVQAADGRWLVMQFQFATLVAEQTYRLVRLLNGQLGTEDVHAAGIAEGAPVVLLDTRVVPLPLRRDEVGLERFYRVGPYGVDAGEEAYVEFAYAGHGRGLVPYSPVHPSAVREPSDRSIVIRWIRRTRIGGDDWESEDVPLGEESELYRAEIGSGGAVLRTVEVESPEYVYTLAEQQADFGGEASMFTLKVAQVAPDFGAGVPTEVVLHVD